MRKRAESNLAFREAEYEYYTQDSPSENNKEYQSANIKTSKQNIATAKDLFDSIGEDGLSQNSLIRHIKTRFKFAKLRDDFLKCEWTESTSPSSLKNLLSEVKKAEKLFQKHSFSPNPDRGTYQKLKEDLNAARQNLNAARANIDLWTAISELIFLGAKNLQAREEELTPELFSLVRVISNSTSQFQGYHKKIWPPRSSDQRIPGRSQIST